MNLRGKKMKRNNVFKFGMIINIIPFIMGGIYYNQLPETMATHFDFNNHANGFSSKPMALFGVPMILFLVYILAYFFTSQDPKRSNQNEKVVAFVLVIIPILNLIVSGMIISVNLGNKVDIGSIINIFIGILFTGLGNYMPKIKRNYTIGIRLPWTLDNDYVWDKTHRFAGYIWSIGGIIYLISAFFLKDYSHYFIPIIILILTIIPTIYSYMVYKSFRRG